MVDAVTSDPLGLTAYMNIGVTQTSYGAEIVNLSSRPAALASINTIDEALRRVHNETNALGSSMSRIQTALSNLAQAHENFVAAGSRITDADVAEESASLLRSQIVQQAGAAILSQANMQPELALLLLGKQKSN